MATPKASILVQSDFFFFFPNYLNDVCVQVLVRSQ